MTEKEIIGMYVDYIVLDKPIRDVAKETGIHLSQLMQIFKDNSLWFKKDFANEYPKSYINKGREFHLTYSSDSCMLMEDLSQVILNHSLNIKQISEITIDIVKHYNKEWLKADSVEWRKRKKVFDT